MAFARRSPPSRPPISEPSLPLAGQSQDKAYRELDDRERNSLAYAILFSLMFIGFEWLRWAINMKPHPLGIMAASAIFLALVYRDYRNSRQEVKNRKLGRDGERKVAQVLNILAVQGCHIFHDIPTGRKNFHQNKKSEVPNIDHAIISRFGIFAIETKTRSKRGQDPKIHYNGQHLRIDGVGFQDEMVDQAEAQARWLREFLSKETGKPVKVQAVLAFPGWYVKGDRSPWEYKTWIVNPKLLLSMVPHGGEVLNEERVRELVNRLGEYVLKNMEV